MARQIRNSRQIETGTRGGRHVDGNSDHPPAGLRRLLRRGARDTLLQTAATTLVRLGLALAVLGLAPFVSLAELGRFDLFVVGSSFALLAVTLGIDSGLAIVTSRHSAAGRRAVLLAALATSMAAALAWAAGLAVVLPMVPDLERETRMLAWATLAYGALNGALTLIFSWFRWQGRAVSASLILIAAHAAGFVCAALSFARIGTILGFVGGLIAGAALGVAGCLLHLARTEGLGRADLRLVRQGWRLRRVVATILGVSLPYVAASVALLLRRAIDRSYLLALGDPALLGAYAIVARLAELAGFAFSLPALGLAPILVARHREAGTLRLARLVYGSYVLASAILVTAAVSLAASIDLPRSLAGAAAAMSLLGPILAGTLFLGELSVAGFGYIVARRPIVYTVFSVGFLALYLSGVAALGMLGAGLQALGWGFASAAFIYSTAAIAMSERLVRYGYAIVPLTGIKMATLALALWSM